MVAQVESLDWTFYIQLAQIQSDEHLQTTSLLGEFSKKSRVLPVFDLASSSNVLHLSQTLGYYSLYLSGPINPIQTSLIGARLVRNLTSGVKAGSRAG